MDECLLGAESTHLKQGFGWLRGRGSCAAWKSEAVVVALDVVDVLV